MSLLLKPVSARIIELVPEIMELKFGCRAIIRILGNDLLFTYAGVSQSDHEKSVREDRKMVYWLSSKNTVVANDEATTFEIIGRPITFEDVVVAIKHHLGVPKGERVAVLRTAPGAAILAVGNRWEWQLPLHQQSPETIAFIGKVLDVNI